ncbi:flavin reductase family protein [Nocardia sp. FBN12]|uniref:flavin reductase family protein n=1 Tax=Nocardia sp. FBN12 TaxID=3419766 RepID=UPI003D0675C4
MDTHQFKEAMARVTGPVAIVTANDHGVPHGTTVSSLASLSLAPAMITIALDNASVLLGVVRRTGSFGVNVLSAEQHETATRFAGRRDDRFADTAWEFADGLPYLPASCAWLHCQVAAEVPGGDHTLILGEVRDCTTSENTPLIYSHRAFGIRAALSPVAKAS